MTSRYQSLVAVGGLVAALCGGCLGIVEDRGKDGGSGADLGPTGITVSPARIPIAGDISISVTAGKSPGVTAVELQQGNAKYKLGSLNADGTLTAKIDKNALSAAFSLGAAEVVLTGSTKKATVRLFLDPVLNGATAAQNLVGNPTKSTEPAPMWIGISNKQILTLNYQERVDLPGNYNQTIGEFVLMAPNSLSVNTTLRYSGYSASVFSANAVQPYTSTGVALTNQAFLLARFEPLSPSMPTALRTCSLLTQDCSPNESLAAFVSVSSLTADKAGTAFAAIVKDTNKVELRSFSDSKLTAPLNIDGSTAKAFPSDTLVSFGLLDSDNIADLIVLSGGTLSVFVRKQSQEFVYDTTLSKAAGAALSAAMLSNLSALSTGDVDGDGLDDIVVAGGNKISFLINQLGAGFANGSSVVVDTTLSPVSSVAIGKVNATDSKAPSDVAIASKSNKRIGVLVNAATY